jgi:hypothetical protein
VDDLAESSRVLAGAPGHCDARRPSSAPRAHGRLSRHRQGITTPSAPGWRDCGDPAPADRADRAGQWTVERSVARGAVESQGNSHQAADQVANHRAPPARSGCKRAARVFVVPGRPIVKGARGRRLPVPDVATQKLPRAPHRPRGARARKTPV